MIWGLLEKNPREFGKLSDPQSVTFQIKVYKIWWWPEIVFCWMWRKRCKDDRFKFMYSDQPSLEIRVPFRKFTYAVWIE